MVFKKRFTCLLIFVLLLIFVFSFGVYCQPNTRTEINIPDIPGHVTLKCDFHMHTIFSDGAVWPTIRADEAWRQGLDAFAVTDHVEYTRADIVKNLNRSHELVLPRAVSLNLIAIKGAELTKPMPPGHFNAIFLKDTEPLGDPDYKIAIKAAVEQGAFIFWNHPPNKWYPEHDELLNNGWLHGIEVVNGLTYYSHSHKWCLEKNLTMICNSDIHDPINLDYDLHDGKNHRPMTLVFAKDRTEEAIKEALFARRTAVYSKNDLIGKEEFLKPIFAASVAVINPEVTIKGKGRANIQIRNKSDLIFELEANGELEEISFPKSITLYPGKTVMLSISGKKEDLTGEREIGVPYKVKNLLVGPDEGMSIEPKIKVSFVQ